MNSISQSAPGNLLLRALPRQELVLLEPWIERVSLQAGDNLAVPGQPVTSIFFPEAGIVSLHDVLADGTRVGIGIIGLEGLTGWFALLGCPASPHEAVVVGGSTALRVDTDQLLRVCEQSPMLNTLLLRFVQAFTIQLGRTALSNLSDSVLSRLARWLLMNHDRLKDDKIHVSHKQLGVMLGMRRASVTDNLHTLEGEHAIRSRRNVITILDRTKLRQLAGEAYGHAEAEYSRLIAPFGR